MAQTLEVKMSRFDNSPWGFRLHGGADFGIPLTVQKINANSPSDNAGLKIGDMVVAVNGKDITACKHKDAQESMVRAGNNFALTVVRGSQPQQQIWRPDVKPVGQMPSAPTQHGQVFTTTSLAASKVPPFIKMVSPSGFDPSLHLTFLKPTITFPTQQRSRGGVAWKEDSHWDVKHNQTAKGFGMGSHQTQQVQNGAAMKSKLANQYNNPIPLYSDDNIKEVLDQKSETLAGGVRGINFNKIQPPATKTTPSGGGDISNSLTLKMVLDQDEKARAASPFRGDPAKAPSTYHHKQQHIPVEPDPSQATPEEKGLINKNVQSASFKLLQRALENEEALLDSSEGLSTCPPVTSSVRAPRIRENPEATSASGFRPVSAPTTKPRPEGQGQPTGPPLSICHACERLITGVFVKVSGNPLHAECFKCSACGCSLKNIGYFNINNKLYCESHAMAAKASQQMGPQGQVGGTPGYQVPKPPIVGQQVHEPKHDQHDQHKFQGNWNTRLEADKAGAASNAEDFTKQFMQQMYGSTNMSSQGTFNTGPAVVKPTQQEGLSMSKTQEQSNNFTASTSRDNMMAPTQMSKKGESHQWPPAKMDDQEATGTPLYVDPHKAGGVAAPGGQKMASSSTVSSGHHERQQQQQQMSSGGGWHPNVEAESEKLGRMNLGGGEGHPMMNSGHSSSQQQQYMQQITKQQTFSSTKSVSEHSSSSGGGILKNQPTGGSSVVGQGQNLVSPRRGKGVLNQLQPGMRVPMCGACSSQIRGPFITALGRNWCPSHFICAQSSCGRSLQDVGFVEEQGHLYCEDCYGKYLAPDCEKCRKKILGNCLKAMSKTFHPECFVCAYCGKIFANSPFYLEDGLPYCEADWNELFTTKCVACGFPIEAGDRWVEALNNNYHSQCFNCTLCKQNLEGKGFFVKAGKPFCKSHAKMRC